MLISEGDGRIKVGKFTFREDLIVIAGPCAIETLEQMEGIAEALLSRNIHFLRAAPFKPRTSPYSFQGLGEEGLEIIRKLKELYPIHVVGEIVDSRDLPVYSSLFDIIQVGARNMQNFELLKALGKANRPVLLKRGFGNTVEEWLYAAEYLHKYGNREVILCERGIRTFEPQTRNTFDVSSIPLARKRTELPILADPSHAAGRRDLIAPLSFAAVAAGADGLLIEVQADPDSAWSDARQTLSLEEFDAILAVLKKLAPLFGKRFD